MCFLMCPIGGRNTSLICWLSEELGWCRSVPTKRSCSRKTQYISILPLCYEMWGYVCTLVNMSTFKNILKIFNQLLLIKCICFHVTWAGNILQRLESVLLFYMPLPSCIKINIIDTLKKNLVLLDKCHRNAPQLTKAFVFCENCDVNEH